MSVRTWSPIHTDYSGGMNFWSDPVMENTFHGASVVSLRSVGLLFHRLLSNVRSIIRYGIVDQLQR